MKLDLLFGWPLAGYKLAAMYVLEADDRELGHDLWLVGHPLSILGHL